MPGRSQRGDGYATPSPTPQPRPKFHWFSTSKFLDPTFVQQEMMDAIQFSRGNGILVLPCGGGKSGAIVDACLKAGTLCLILCYESQGVHQMAQLLDGHTSLCDSQICVHCGNRRDPYDKNFCFFITTYGMFSSTAAKRSKVSQEAREFVLNTKWDLVCCDEAHHMCATTYMPLIKDLMRVAKRMLAFTATLIRSELCEGPFLSAEHEEAAFGWFGPVLFRRKCKDLEDAGLIAKIRRARIEVDLTREFAIAHHRAKGSQKIYIAALNPAKLNAMVALCAFHRGMGHTGIVFVTHLLVARVVKACLAADGARCEVLSGGSAHGEDEVHDAAGNAEIVKSFNEHKLDVVVATMVGCGAMDLYRQECCYMVVMDADGGLASAGQRLGRVARSVHEKRDEFESEEDMLQHRLCNQKTAAYYDLLTRGTADISAAAKRQLLFTMEGYEKEEVMSADEIISMATQMGTKLPYTRTHEQALLLRDALEYRALGGVCAVANVAATSVKAPHKRKMKEHAATAKNAKQKVMRELGKHKFDRAKAIQKRVDKEAKAARDEVLANAAMSEDSRRIFQACDFATSALEEANLLDEVIWAPSDEDEY